MTQTLDRSRRHLQSWSDVALLAVNMLLLAVLFAAIPLNAQVVNGIQGTVADSSGAVVPGAHVTVTNIATGVVSTAATSSEGTFTVVGLNPGRYSIEVNEAQFKKVETEITVEVAKMSAVNIKLVPGSNTETVQVRGGALSLETTSPVLGATLEPELVKTAPIEINGLARQIDSFMFLAPGVQGTAANHNINGGLTF